MLNRLEMMRIFSVVAESNSFKESATRLGISPQKITRIIQELERITGEGLFHRNTRSIQITEFGQSFHEKVKILLAQADDLFIDKGPKVSDLAGTVRIAVSKSFGRKYLIQILKPFFKQYPEIILDIKASDSISDVVEEKIDVGIRVGVLKDSTLIARAVGKVDFIIVGAPSLIKKVGKPKSIIDLHRLPTTHLMNMSTGRPWQWNLNGEDFLPARPAFLSNDPEIELEAILNGVGFAQVGGPLVREYLKNGKLVEVMQDHSTDSWNLYVYRPQRTPVPKRIRLVYDHLIETLSENKVFPMISEV